MNMAFNWSIWFICKDPYNNFLFPIIEQKANVAQIPELLIYCFSQNKTRAAQLLSRQLWSLFILFWENVCAYTTLCKPSVFSISSITPSVATIIMVASAAMVGSK